MKQILRQGVPGVYLEFVGDDRGKMGDRQEGEIGLTEQRSFCLGTKSVNVDIRIE